MRALPTLPTWLTLLSLASFAVPAIATAGELSGVTMDDSVTESGKTLRLVGMGQRTAFTFKIYVLGLYMERPSTDTSEIIGSDQVRRIDMTMQRDLDGSTIGEAVEKGFERNNSAEALVTLRERLDTLIAAFPAVDKGAVVSLIYTPGHGTEVRAGGQVVTSIAGKDFADALMAVWFGDHPVDDQLLAGVLQ